jgi:calcium permeable stress-gated cation channel
VATPTSVVTDSEIYDDDSDSDFDANGFDHPSTYAEQPWIWVAKDELGLSERLVAELRKSGIDASDQGAFMDHYGNVEVTSNPPDEAWTG